MVHGWNEVTLAIPDHVLSRSVGDDTVLLDLNQDEYFSLDAIGTRVWAGLNAHLTLGEIVGSIATTYGVGSEQVETDVRTLVESLVGSGLLIAV
jgi:Coenzyme PQQ synthesis protein D (PqqD)